MELRHLRAFLAVAEEGTVTRAAKRLYITQPALSRSVRELERHVASPLFLRMPRGVELTAAGQRLLGRARALLADADGLARTASEDAGTGQPLRIGLQLDVATSVMPYLRAVACLPGTPSMAFEHRVIETELWDMLDTDEVDLVFQWWPRDDPSDVVRHVLDEPLLLVAPAGPSPAPHPRPSLAEVGRSAVVLFDRASNPYAFDGLAAELRGQDNDQPIHQPKIVSSTSGQRQMVDHALGLVAPTVVAASSWYRWSRDGMSARPLAASVAPISAAWLANGRAAGVGPSLSAALASMHALRRAQVGAPAGRSVGVAGEC